MKLALTLPGNYTIQPSTDLYSKFVNNAPLASLISGILEIVLYLAVFLAFFWLCWGAFQYLISRGNKEEVAKARGRIIWALVGLVIILLAFTLTKYFGEIFPVNSPSPAQGGLPF